MTFLKIAKVCMVVSAALAVGALALLFVPGPQVSIEFTGGTLMELKLPADKTKQDLQNAIRAYAAQDNRVSTDTIAQTKTGTFFVRLQTLDADGHKKFLAALESSLKAQELQYTTIGPTVGQSLKRHAVYALLAASLAIIVYLAFAFRKMPRSLSPWSFGVSAVVALLHDLVITTGLFVILSRTTAFQMDTLFVTALLSIMGHSVSDTIVIFDRIRDNLAVTGQREDFAKVAVQSLRQSFTRTVNMGIAVLTMLTSLFFLGSESIRWFMLTLIVGTIIGSYSSYMIATPLVIFWKRHADNKKKR
jgi:preprotein translocase subunit SecF